MTGPVERSAVKLVAALVWPDNAASRTLGRAVVLAARRVDETPGRARWREELAEAVAALRVCRSDADLLEEFRARLVLRRCSVTEAALVSVERLRAERSGLASVVELTGVDDTPAR